MKILEVLIIAYLLGSIPFGYLAGLLGGVDVRQHGSGNIGATNVLRLLGKGYGYPVFLADALKGFFAVRVAFWIGNGQSGEMDKLGIIAAVFAVVGHSFPVWLRFRGGKGVATSAGACFGLTPVEAIIAAAAWIVTFFLFRFVSLASITAAAVLPASILLIPSVNGRARGLILFFTAALAALVIVRHRSNLRRLLQGTEPRFERK